MGNRTGRVPHNRHLASQRVSQQAHPLAFVPSLLSLNASMTFYFQGEHGSLAKGRKACALGLFVRPFGSKPSSALGLRFVQKSYKFGARSYARLLDFVTFPHGRSPIELLLISFPDGHFYDIHNH